MVYKQMLCFRWTQAQSFTVHISYFPFIFMTMIYSSSKMSYTGCMFLCQPISDREGKRCMFCVKTHNKTFEMSASDQRQKVEWTQGVLVCINICIQSQRVNFDRRDESCVFLLSSVSTFILTLLLPADCWKFVHSSLYN